MNQKTSAPLVFILEDNAFFAQSIALGLENNGFETAWFSKGESMLDNLKLRKPDAIILDYHLENEGIHSLNGGHFLDILKAMYPGIPVLMLTAMTDTSEAVKLLKTGAVDFILKDDQFFQNVLKSLHDILRAKALSQELKSARELMHHQARRLTFIVATVAVAVVALIIIYN